MSGLSSRPLLALLAALAGASLVIAAGAQASAITETHHFSYPQDFTFVNPCTGDPIAFTGEFDAVVHVTITDSGHLSVISPGVVSHTVGTDLVTGQTFRLVGTSSNYESLDLDGYPFEYTINLISNFVGQGPGNNLIQHELIHVTADAGGQVTADLSDVSINCR
jgi:hypothetical protein